MNSSVLIVSTGLWGHQRAQSGSRESAAPQLPGNQLDARILLRWHYPATHCTPPTLPSPSPPQPRAGLAGQSPDNRRSTSDPRSEISLSSFMFSIRLENMNEDKWRSWRRAVLGTPMQFS